MNQTPEMQVSPITDLIMDLPLIFSSLNHFLIPKDYDRIIQQSAHNFQYNLRYSIDCITNVSNERKPSQSCY